MPSRIRRVLLMILCTAAIAAMLAIGANAYETYTYPNMPDDWESVQVTVGDVVMPFARYPSGSVYSPDKRYMTVEEQREYGFSVGGNLDLRGWECVGFARYAYAALFYRPNQWPQNSSIDTSLAYNYAGSYAYVDMIEAVLGTRTLDAGYSAQTLKTLFTACRPGAVMRCGGHSMVLMAIYNDGFLIYDANFSSNNEVNVRAYTWQSFVDRMGGRGIQALQMPSYYPGYSYSTGDNTYYQVDESVMGTYVVYNCSSLNVRVSPSTSSARVGGLDRDEEIQVIGIYDDWYQIVYMNRACWVYSSYLRSKDRVVEVTFDPNGGRASLTSGTFTAGQTFGSLPAATKSDRVFLGWYYDTTRCTENSTVPSAPGGITLKAKWGVLGYEDVPDDSWYAPYVETACNRGILSRGSNFYPYEMATRAQMITALGREYEWETGETIYNTGASDFRDVPAWEYYAKYVVWAKQAGIANGTSDVTFEPGLNITREQIAIFLYRLAIYTGRASYSSPDMSLLYQFHDGASISSYARAAMSWAVKVGLLKGDDLGNVNPQANASRAEMITMICRYTEFTRSINGRAAKEPEAVFEEVTEEPEEAAEVSDESVENAEGTVPEAGETETEEMPAEPEAQEAEERNDTEAPAEEALADPLLLPDENGIAG